MIFKRTSKSNPIGNQRGIYIVFTAIMAIALLSIIALVVEVGRILIVTRELRAGSEAAALAGVQRLHKCDPNVAYSTPLNFDCSGFPGALGANGQGGWQAVKPAVIVALTNMRLSGGWTGTVAFSSNPTRCDINDTIDGFGNLQYTTGSDGQRMTVKVERLFECIDNTGAVVLRSLEKDSYNPVIPYYHYCYANAVRVTLSYPNFASVMGNIIGANSTRSLTRSSVARMHSITSGLACSFPSCSLLNEAVQRCPVEAC